MVKKRILDPVPVLDQALLLQALRDEGIKELHARAAWQYALAAGKEHGPDATFDGFEEAEFQLDAPANLGPLLRHKFAVLTSTVVEQQLSEDGTIKLLVRLQDGQMVETVIISHGGKHPRTTLCVSSQVGCQMGCTFCATGTMGLQGDLTAGEILEQVLHASRVSPIRNVVFMGMGEPLNNYDAVLASIRGMSDSRMFKLSPRHITLSTVGVVSRMKQLTLDAPETQLALSLHAPNQELRNKIVPSARAYRLEKLMDALDGHLRGPGIPPPPPPPPTGISVDATRSGDEDRSVGSRDTVEIGEEAEERIAGVLVGGKGLGRRALIEYVMLAGVNDTEECARQLGELLKGRNLVVNLIPYNPTYAPGSESFEEPSEESLQTFKKIVHEYGLLVTIRRHHGRDIDGACGQLALRTVATGGTGTTDSGQSGGCGGGNGRGGAATNDIEDLVRSNKRGRGKSKATVRRGRRDASSRGVAEEKACHEDRSKGRWAGVVLTLVAAVGVVVMVHWRMGCRSRGR